MLGEAAGRGVVRSGDGSEAGEEYGGGRSIRRAAGGGADEEDAQAGVELVGFRGGGDRWYSRFLGPAHEGFVEG